MNEALEALTAREAMLEIEPWPVKAANVADMLESVIHRVFTVEADELFQRGTIRREERIALSAAIGDALDAFHGALQGEMLASLASRSPYEEAEVANEAGKASGHHGHWGRVGGGSLSWREAERLAGGLFMAGQPVWFVHEGERRRAVIVQAKLVEGAASYGLRFVSEEEEGAGLVAAGEPDVWVEVSEMQPRDYKALAAEWERLELLALEAGTPSKHYGPGPHKGTGSQQAVHAGTEKVRVGITSWRDPEENPDEARPMRQTFEEMRAFEAKLRTLEGVRNVRVQPGVGGWQGGSEPTWVVSYTGNGEAMRLLAETGKAYNQDAVLVMKAGESEDVFTIEFGEHLSPDERDGIEAQLADLGVGGWTWFRDRGGHAKLRMVSVPQWESVVRAEQMEALQGWLSWLGYETTLRHGKVAVTLMERESYDEYIN